MPEHARGAAAEWRQGWKVTFAAAMGMALASLAAYAPGVFIAPLEAEFGWSRAQISGGLTLSSVISVFSAPFVGMAVDRFGPRRIGVLGVFLYCICFALFTFTGPSIWSWLGLWLPFALAGAAIKPTIWTAGVSSMFTTSRGLAISVMLCGTALGSSLTPIVSNYLIDAYGWRNAFVGVAAFWGLLVIPPVLLLFSSAKDKARSRPTTHTVAAPVLTGISVSEGLRSWKFVRLAMAAFVTSLCVVSFVGNLVPILSFGGLPRQHAANTAGLVGLATVVGRLSAGYLLDRVNGGVVGAVSVSMAIISSVMLLAFPGSLAVATVAVLVLGLSLGGELDAVAYLSTRHFGMRNFGVLFGTISGLLALSTGLGPFLVSLTYDITRSYNPVLVAYVPLSVMAALLFVSLGKYPVFEQPAGHDLAGTREGEGR